MPVYLEPVWSVPQEAFGRPDKILSSSISPFALTGIFERFIQAHFYSADNVLNPQLKGYVWYPDVDCPLPALPAGSSSPESFVAIPVYIASAYEFDPKQVQRIPAIYVKREEVRNESMSQQNARTPSAYLPGLVHDVKVSGSHSLICVGGNGTEAEALGEELYTRFNYYHMVLRDEFRLGGLFVGGLSAVKEVEITEAKKAFYTVVPINWAYILQWVLVQETPTIKRINLAPTR